MDNSLRRGTWEMVCAMLISGTIGWFVLASHVPLLEVVFWRCLIGSVTLAAVCQAIGCLNIRRLTLRELGWIVLSGVAIVGNWLLLFASYSKASIAIGTAVYNVQPFFLAVLAAVFLGEKVTLQKLAWLAAAFLGMLAIVSAHGDQQTSGSAYLGGVAFAAGAAFLYAVAALIIKRLQGVPPHLIALIQVITGALLLAPMVKWQSLPAAPSSWAALGILGVVHTGFMYILLYGAIQKLPTTLTGALSFIYPVAAILVDLIGFGHRMGMMQWVGVGAILIAAAGMQRGWGLRSMTRAKARSV